MEKLNHRQVTAGLVVLIVGLTAFAAGQVTTQQSNGEDYNLTVENLPPYSEAASAKFSANLTELDADADAALIYWNYSQDDSLDKKGPSTIAFSENEKVEANETNLVPGTQYTVNAYAEPIVWSDEVLLENIFEKSDLNEDIGVRTGLLKDTNNNFWADSNLSEEFIDSFNPQPPSQLDAPEGHVHFYTSQDSFTGGKVLEIDQDSGSSGGGADGPYLSINQTFNLTDVSRINISTNRGGPSPGYDAFELRLDGDTLLVDGTNHNWKEFSVDVSSYSGVSLMELGHQVGRYQQRSVNTWIADIEFIE